MSETFTTLDDVNKALSDLDKRLTAVEKRREGGSLTTLRARVEELLDFVYGTNVRPPVKERGEDDFGAEIDTQGNQE